MSCPRTGCHDALSSRNRVTSVRSAPVASAEGTPSETAKPSSRERGSLPLIRATASLSAIRRLQSADSPSLRPAHLRLKDMPLHDRGDQACTREPSPWPRRAPVLASPPSSWLSRASSWQEDAHPTQEDASSWQARASSWQEDAHPTQEDASSCLEHARLDHARSRLSSIRAPSTHARSSSGRVGSSFQLTRAFLQRGCASSKQEDAHPTSKRSPDAVHTTPPTLCQPPVPGTMRTRPPPARNGIVVRGALSPPHVSAPRRATPRALGASVVY
jgi:hypothetical protein